MSKFQRKNTGLAPGSLVFTGEQRLDASTLHVVTYDETYFSEANYTQALPEPTLYSGVTWYDLKGIHDVSLMEQIGQDFNIHKLILEDILDIRQRPKFEAYPDGIFLTAKALSLDKSSSKILQEHVSIYFSNNFLFSFQEDNDDLFARVRARLNMPASKLRQRKTDYLAYALLDAIVDGYYLVLDHLENQTGALEKRIQEETDDGLRQLLYDTRSSLLQLRRYLMPLREAVHQFAKSDSPLIADNTHLFLRDLFDHTLEITEMLDVQRDLVNSMSDWYLSAISYRMNKIIQLLTIISTIFIPLTFLVGVYGMNFKNMPELSSQYGYFYLWIFMFVLALVMLLFFKRKQWL